MVKIASFLLTPTSMIVAAIAVGLLLAIRKATRRFSIHCFVVAALLFFLFGCGPVAYFLMSRLEFRYPALDEIEKETPVDAIAVLAGHAVDDAIYPLSSKINDATAFRLLEAFRWWRQFPQADLYLAGPLETTGIMKDLLVALGVPKSSVRQAEESRSTWGNVSSLAALLKNRRFLLITSAGHMPRVMAIFEKHDMQPIPAPTDFYTTPQVFRAGWLPTVFNLKCSELAIHEYLALAIIHLKR